MRAYLRALMLVVPTINAVLGCGSSEKTDGHEHDTPSSPDAGEDGAVSVCINGDPSKVGPEDTCGIFVSSTLGAAENPGTLKRPMRTLGKALAVAREGSRRVYACAEVFREAVEIPAGVA